MTNAGTPHIHVSQVPTTSTLLLQPLDEHYYTHDDPIDINEDFDVGEPSNNLDHDELDVDEEVPSLPETIAPGLNIRGIKKAKHYENSVSQQPFSKYLLSLTIRYVGCAFDDLEEVPTVILGHMYVFRGSQALLYSLRQMLCTNAVLSLQGLHVGAPMV